MLKRYKKENEKSTSWGNVADWYDENVEQEGSYQRDLILPNIIRLMNIKPGDNIIDIACGQGMFSREFTKLGAAVVGIDVSPELITIVKDRSKRMNVEYKISSAEKINGVKSGEFDKATIVLAIQDIENLSGVINEASRVLKSNGELFIVINHPNFRIPKRSSWGFDDVKKIQYRRVDEYISESRVKIEVPPSPRLEQSRDTRSGQATTSFHRPLQTYFKAFQKAGFAVSRLEEWVSGKQSEKWPRADAENEARREFPLFMALVLKKLT